MNVRLRCTQKSVHRYSLLVLTVYVKKLDGRNSSMRWKNAQYIVFVVEHPGFAVGLVGGRIGPVATYQLDEREVATNISSNGCLTDKTALVMDQMKNAQCLDLTNFTFCQSERRSVQEDKSQCYGKSDWHGKKEHCMIARGTCLLSKWQTFLCTCLAITSTTSGGVGHSLKEDYMHVDPSYRGEAATTGLQLSRDTA